MFVQSFSFLSFFILVFCVFFVSNIFLYPMQASSFVLLTNDFEQTNAIQLLYYRIKHVIDRKYDDNVGRSL